MISLKVVLIFPKNFLNFWLNMIEKQRIVNINSYSRKSYAYVVLCWGRERCNLSFISLRCLVY